MGEAWGEKGSGGNDGLKDRSCIHEKGAISDFRLKRVVKASNILNHDQITSIGVENQNLFHSCNFHAIFPWKSIHPGWFAPANVLPQDFVVESCARNLLAQRVPAVEEPKEHPRVWAAGISRLGSLLHECFAENQWLVQMWGFP